MANPIEVIKRIRAFEEGWGDFIRNGPATGLPGYVRDKYRERCDQYANLPGWAKLLSNPVAGSLARACQPYWDDQGTDGPVSEPPFPGGQCSTTRYAFTWQRFSGGNPTTTGSFDLIGPLTLTKGSGPSPVPECPDGQSYSIVLMSGGDGGSVTLTSGCDVDATILTVSPLFGGVDDCGDPPDQIVPGPNPPPDPGPLPGPEPTDDPDNPFGPPLVPIPPYEDPVYGPIPIVGDPDPTGPGGGGNPSGGDGLPGDPDAVGEDTGGAGGGADGEDVDFGQPPDGKIWVGALVQAVVDSRLGNIPGTGPEQTVYPTVIGNASLIYTGGRGTNERLESSSTLLTRQTTALVLTGCRVQAQPGVSLTVRPISATTCPDNPCEEPDG